jgi:hypothetical protein
MILIDVRFHWSTGMMDVAVPAVPRIGETVVLGDGAKIDITANVKKVEHNIIAYKHSGTSWVILVTLDD